MPETRSALLVDYGGVLTTSVSESFRDFCDDAGLPPGLAQEAFLEAYGGPGGDGPIHRVETGAITPDEFAVGLAEVLSERSGISVSPKGLVRRLFAGMQPDEAMFSAVAATRRQGIRTGLLSNSWGSDGYPRQRFAALFDIVVISGEVGVRKPDPQIYELATRRLGVAASDCVFIDDIQANVVAAETAGMAGIVHRDAETTIPQMARLLGVPPGALAGAA